MAEDDGGDKTEAATPRGRQEAREEGNVAASSSDLTSAVMMLSLLMLVKWFGGDVVTALRGVVQMMLGGASLASNSSEAMAAVVKCFIIVGRAMAPLLLGAMVVAIAINVAQVGLILNPARVQLNFAALSPMRGMSRIFGGGRGAAGLVMSLLKFGLVSLVAYSAVHSRAAEIITMGQLNFLQIFGLGGEIVYAVAFRIVMILLILALIDYIYQRYQHEQQLKMSKHDVREEMRRMEGDPKIKQRRRQIANQRAMQRFKKDVPTADVVVTNPTEFAIALKYDSTTMRAPRVVAKGRGFMAARIREIAIEAGIPILERKPLARALYKLVDVGKEIPEEFYSAVAEILAYVYELSRRVRQPA